MILKHLHFQNGYIRRVMYHSKPGNLFLYSTVSELQLGPVTKIHLVDT